MRRWCIGALTGMVVSTTVSAQTSEPAATAPATAPTSAPAPPHDAAFWDTLLQHLALAAQAQRDLKATVPADRVKLQALADAATDPDIKSSLAARVEALDEEIALNPPPLALDVKDASLSEVAAALKKAMDVPFDSWPPGGRGGSGGTFTLQCQGKSFWEIFTALSAQHPLRLQNYNGTRIEQARQGYRHYVPGPCGLAVFPLAITRSHGFDPQKPEGQQESPPSLNFHYALAMDPRIRIIKYMPPVIEEVKDDAGHDLINHAVDVSSSNMWDVQQGQCFFEQNTQLVAPSGLGTKIVSLKGQTRFLVQLSEDRVEVDPLKVLNKPIAVGEHVVTVSSFKVEGSTINFQINCPAENNGVGMGVAFIDANDQVVWATRMQGGLGGGTGGQFVEPVKIRFSAARKTKLLTIPFEMKDLPLP